MRRSNARGRSRSSRARRRRLRSRRRERRGRARRRRPRASDGRGRSRSRATCRARASARRRRAPKRVQLLGREHAATTRLAARDALELAQLLEAGRCARSSPSRCRAGSPRVRMRSAGRKPSPRSASVVGQAQIVAPDEARRSSSAPSACVACTTVVRSREAAGPREQLDRAAAVLGEALLDLPRLLVGVDVERKPLGAGVARRSPRASRQGTRARSGGRRRRACPASRSASTCSRILRDRLLAEAGETAARVRDVEEHELDARR